MGLGHPIPKNDAEFLFLSAFIKECEDGEDHGSTVGKHTAIAILRTRALRAALTAGNATVMAAARDDSKSLVWLIKSVDVSAPTFSNLPGQSKYPPGGPLEVVSVWIFELHLSKSYRIVHSLGGFFSNRPGFESHLCYFLFGGDMYSMSLHTIGEDGDGLRTDQKKNARKKEKNSI